LAAAVRELVKLACERKALGTTIVVTDCCLMNKGVIKELADSMHPHQLRLASI